MNLFKKAGTILVTAVMVLQLSGCTPGSPEDFDQFLEELPAKLISADNFNMNYLLTTRKNTGLKKRYWSFRIRMNRTISSPRKRSTICSANSAVLITIA